jgi:formylglycine-generating enzyme
MSSSSPVASRSWPVAWLVVASGGFAACACGSPSPEPSPQAASPGGEPPGMVWVPGGEFTMGGPDGYPDASPSHRVRVHAFWMDATEVTNAQFAAFVDATGYATVAERSPDPRQFPNAPASLLVPGSVVFTPPSGPVPLTDPLRWWRYQRAASWRRPEGPQSDLDGRENVPVIHVAWDDAVAYARWAGKRLPTEAEWEFAARGGLDGRPYVWGDEFRPQGRFMANTWQGRFPVEDRGEDGHRGPAPVASYPANGWGLYDMAGNVWEWCSDWYRADTYARRAKAAPIVDPQGPPDSFDPEEPGVPKRVQRGGSFLCTDQYCSRYMPGTRGRGAPDTGASHLGFRCVRDGGTARLGVRIEGSPLAMPPSAAIDHASTRTRRPAAPR